MGCTLAYLPSISLVGKEKNIPSIVMEYEYVGRSKKGSCEYEEQNLLYFLDKKENQTNAIAKDKRNKNERKLSSDTVFSHDHATHQMTIKRSCE